MRAALFLAHTLRYLPPMNTSFLRNALVAGSTTLISRVLGFVRDAAMAWILGTGPAADALSVALRLPWAVRRLLGEGALSLHLTAACTGHACPARLALAVSRRLVLPMLALLAVLLFAAPWFVQALAPGASPSVRADAVPLLRLALPYVFFALFSACCMAGLHALGRFALPGAMSSLFNLSVLCCAGMALLFGLTGPDAAKALAFGVLLGGLLQWLLVSPSLFRRCRREPPSPSLDDATRAVLRALPSGLFGAAVPQLCFMVAGFCGSWLGEGHMSALFYAERLLEFPLGIMGAAVSMAAVPELKKGHAATSRILKWTLLLHTLAALGLLLLSRPIVSLLFGYGSFDTQSIDETAAALQLYALSLPAYAASRPLLAACHMQGVPHAASRSAIYALAACITTGLVLTLLLHSTAGPPLAVCAGLTTQSLYLQRALPSRAF